MNNRSNIYSSISLSLSHKDLCTIEKALLAYACSVRLIDKLQTIGTITTLKKVSGFLDTVDREDNRKDSSELTHPGTPRAIAKAAN